MIYATRRTIGGRLTLVEFHSHKELIQYKRMCEHLRGALPTEVTAGVFIYEQVSPEFARKWVLDSKEHETGLWVDDGKVRYARSEKAKAEGEIHSPSGRSAPSIGSTPRIGLTSDGAREPNNETINLG